MLFLAAATHPCLRRLIWPAVLEVKITPGHNDAAGSQVPISRRDRVWIKADFPPTQSAPLLDGGCIPQRIDQSPPESCVLPLQNLGRFKWGAMDLRNRGRQGPNK